VPEIARELDVRMVLEGSVRKQGDRVRVTAQLIDASTGYHAWSQTFDRELKDIFAIQDEIAHAIARQLRVDVAGVREGTETSDLAAYDHYLRGLALWQARGQGNLDQAQRLFERAIALDPRFAKAWAGVALVNAVRPDWFGTPTAVAYAAARDAAEHALALDPTLPEPFAVLGSIALAEGREATGHALFEHSLALAPSYATAYQWFGEGLLAAGDVDASVERSRRAMTLDPRSAVVSASHAYALLAAGRDSESLAVCDRVLAQAPDWLGCLLTRFDVAVTRGDLGAARAALHLAARGRGEAGTRFADELLEVLERRADHGRVAERLLSLPDGIMHTTSPSPLGGFDAVVWFQAAGRNDLALARLERMAEDLPVLARMALNDQHLDPLRCEPRFQALVNRLGGHDRRAERRCGIKSIVP
jgi:tetratricopeptide (TPR) repeat protein